MSFTVLQAKCIFWQHLQELGWDGFRVQGLGFRLYKLGWDLSVCVCMYRNMRIFHVDGWMDGWMEGGREGGTDGRKDGWIDI